jgi:hypothetical protein
MEQERKRLRQEYKRDWIAKKRAENKRVNSQRANCYSDSDDNGDLHTDAPKLDYTFEDLHSNDIGDSGFPDTCDSFSGSEDENDAEDYSKIWDEIDEDITVAFSSDDSDDCDEVRESLEEGLIDWALQFQIKHNAIDSLLKLLQKHEHPSLPSTARTLLNTRKNVPVKTVSGMDYFCYDLECELVKQLEAYPNDVISTTDTLELSFNVDGLPLFKSSGMTLWPVLCCIVNLLPLKVFPVVLTCGNSKPTDLLFLSEFIDNLKILINEGLMFRETLLQISVRCVVCDAPAKAFVKKVKQFSGYHGCDKCDQRGNFIGEGRRGRITYQNVTNLNLRTDESFRVQSQPDHHTGISPFCDLPINMVDAFPIDYMHQVCLGTMKRLLKAWIKGANRKVRLSALQTQLASEGLVSLKKAIPDCFARKPRSLMEIGRWKATEFRQFLLYTGKLVMKDILSEELFDHFMCFSFAVAILVCPNTARQQRLVNYAHELLMHFVSKGRDLYGKELLVYNVHSLLHLSKEVEVNGALDNCSAFPFENYMQKLKRLVRSGRNPLAQIVKRVEELHFQSSENNGNSKKISIKRPNNAFILNGLCCEVEDQHGFDNYGCNQYLCRLYHHSDCEAFCSNPSDSRIIGAYKVDQCRAHMGVLSATHLQKAQRAILLQKEGQQSLVFLGVLHGNE